MKQRDIQTHLGHKMRMFEKHKDYLNVGLVAVQVNGHTQLSKFVDGIISVTFQR
jgi:hypothetical protein